MNFSNFNSITDGVTHSDKRLKHPKTGNSYINKINAEISYPMLDRRQKALSKNKENQSPAESKVF